MSWVKSVASSEDVFDEEVDDISLQNKEWKYNMEKRAKVREQSFINAEPFIHLRKPAEIFVIVRFRFFQFKSVRSFMHCKSFSKTLVQKKQSVLYR